MEVYIAVTLLSGSYVPCGLDTLKGTRRCSSGLLVKTHLIGLIGGMMGCHQVRRTTLAVCNRRTSRALGAL